MKKMWFSAAIVLGLFLNSHGFSANSGCGYAFEISEVDDMLKKIREDRQFNNVSGELAAFKTAKEALNALNQRRFLKPPAAIVEGYYVGHLQRALELGMYELGYKGRTSNIKAQAARLVYIHPRLFSQMVSEGLKFTYSTEGQIHISEFYLAFLAKVVRGMQSTDSQSLLADTFNMSKLSLVRISERERSLIQNDVDAFKLRLQNLQLQSGTVGYGTWETKDPVSYVAAVNTRLKRLLPGLLDGRAVNIHELSIEDADMTSRTSLAMAQRLDILLNQSERWDYLASDKEFLDTLNPGSEPVERAFLLNFYTKGAAESWVPPKDVTITSRVGSMIGISISRAARAIQLDADPRIRTFSSVE
jgi:hypothetical protein